MKIDQTRLKAFWDNPERYRLAFELDIVPAKCPYALARGITFHLTLDLLSQGVDQEKIKDILFGRAPDPSGRILELAPQAIANGWALAKAYVEQAPDYEILLSEAEYEIPIKNSPHSGVGRLDRLILTPAGEQWLLEFKTARTGTKYQYKHDDWIHDIQADMEILGARILGFDPKGVKIQYVEEGNPPKVCHEYHVTRTQEHLELAKLKIHQTCETIEFYRKRFGIDQPWPHLETGWTCRGDGSRCEYRDICQKPGLLVPEELGVLFARRQEHLEIMREDKLCLKK